jgi:hypothetical protein
MVDDPAVATVPAPEPVSSESHTVSPWLCRTIFNACPAPYCGSYLTQVAVVDATPATPEPTPDIVSSSSDRFLSLGEG